MEGLLVNGKGKSVADLLIHSGHAKRCKRHFLIY